MVETLAMVVHDAAAVAEQRASDAAVDGGGDMQLVPYVAPPPATAVEVSAAPIDAVPLATAAPRRAVAGSVVVVVPVEPPWIRERMFPQLHLRQGLPVIHIGEKALTATDMDPHQNRLRLPNDSVRRNLRPILTPADLNAANLLHDDDDDDLPRPAKKPKLNEASTAPEQLQGGIIRKKTGKKHGGLPVLLVNAAGGVRKMTLARWESSRGTIVKGEGYMAFMKSSGFRQGDMVDIWAFKERHFRLFGVTITNESLLHLAITKKEEDDSSLSTYT